LAFYQKRLALVSIHSHGETLIPRKKLAANSLTATAIAPSIALSGTGNLDDQDAINIDTTVEINRENVVIPETSSTTPALEIARTRTFGGSHFTGGPEEGLEEGTELA
jgi:hypothetical protein